MKKNKINVIFIFMLIGIIFSIEACVALPAKDNLSKSQVVSTIISEPNSFTPSTKNTNTPGPSPTHRIYFESSDKKMKVSDFDTLKIGMTIDEVEAIVGKAHHPIGSTILILCYDLVDGNEMVLMYNPSEKDHITLLLFNMYIRHPDGSKTGLLLTSGSPVPSNDSEYKLFYDQQEIVFPEEDDIFVYQGEIYVPLEYYSECLGKVVYISEETNRINICSTKEEGYVPIATDPDRKPLNRNEFNFISKDMSGTLFRDQKV